MVTPTTKTSFPERLDTFVKSKIFNVGIVIFFSIIIASLIVYGVLSHEEPGYMTVTPDWQRSDFPLQVCPMAYVGDSAEAISIASDVIATINGRLDFDALKISQTADCDINVTIGVPTEAGFTEPGGNARISPKHCKVETANVHGELRDLTLEHEFGHCLSLSEDFYKQSIMYGGSVNRRSATPTGELPPWISDGDRALLRADFAPQK